MNDVQRAGPVDRVLRLFTDVRAGEAPTALLLTFNIFLILTAYSVLKVVRDAMILAGSGAEAKAYTSAGQVLLLSALVPLYGIVAARVPRRRLINSVTAVFVACLGGFYFAREVGLSIDIVFFVWVGIFNVMIISQAWAFANDVYTTDEGKRLFPIIGFGAASGAILGAYIPRVLEGLGIPQLFILAAGFLVVAVTITNAVDRRERRRTERATPDAMTSGVMPAATGQYRTVSGNLAEPSEAYQKETGTFKIVKPSEDSEQPGSTAGAFQLVLRNRYLLLIGFLILLLNWVNTTGGYILDKMLVQAAGEAAATGEVTQEVFLTNFFSGFNSVVNTAALVIQLFLVSRILKYLGVRVALVILPVVALVGYTVLVFVPILSAVRWTKTAENATDYSLMNTVRNVLFLPTTREEKYKAKQVVDSFFWRAGDLLSAMLVLFGTTVVILEPRHFAMVNVALATVFLALAYLVGRRYVRLAAATEN